MADVGGFRQEVVGRAGTVFVDFFANNQAELLVNF